MRGAWEIFYEYILELHDRMNDFYRQEGAYRWWKANGDFILVGDDGGMHVIAGEYHCQTIVLGEISSVSCL